MAVRVPRLSFRCKVMLLAVILVAAIQLGTLLPALRAIKLAQQDQAERSVRLAGVVYEEFIGSRTETLIDSVSVLILDWPFREAVGLQDVATIESTLDNHASRLGTDTAAIYDIDGRLIASIGSGRDLGLAAPARLAPDPGATQPIISIDFVGGRPYQTVTVPVHAPTPIAWATLGFPIDETLAHRIRTLTGLETTFLSFDVGRTRIFATTLNDEWRQAAFADVHLGQPSDAETSFWGTDWITRLRPFREGSTNAGAERVYVALQLPMMEAMSSYRNLRNGLLLLTAVALVASIAAAIRLSRKVTRPINRLVEGARRMREGIYNQPIELETRDEFGVLAAGFNSMQQAIAARERDIVHMAHHDSLSGLPTREIVVAELQQAIGNVDRLAVIHFALHRFDELASSVGHRTADRLIQLVAQRLQGELGDGQLLGHIQHQEFVLVLPGAGRAQAEGRVRAIQTLLRSGVAVDGANVSLQAKAGIALFPDHAAAAAELLRCAGIARSNASHHLGSVGIYESGQEERALKRIRIVGDFPRALQNGELWLEFQPKVVCESMELGGAEALVRWRHPELGRLSPETFVGAIEQAGGISQLTRWVLREAAATLAAWKRRGLVVSVAVNVSADDLIDDYLPDYLSRLFGEHGLDRRLLTLEITESTIMHDVDHSLHVLGELRRLGCRVAIDDFGTGHSALAQLKRLPVDELKIDKSFVLNIDDARDEAVVRTATELARQFGLATVAEGVETEACLARLRRIGCEAAQGFYIAPPMHAEDFRAWARSWAEDRATDIVALVAAAASPRGAGQ